MQIIREEIVWNGKSLSFETGYLAKQADSSVLVKYGDTIILACVCVNQDVLLDVDFVPLSVHYIEKAFAAGKIPGGFFKREGKASEKEVLSSRLIDRPLRPTISEDFKYELQLVITVLSYDQETDVDIIALLAASAALQISGVPTSGVIAGCRVSKGFNVETDKADNEYNFVTSNGNKEVLDLVVAGSQNGILMVESSASEINEDEILAAIQYGYKEFQPLIKVISDFKQAYIEANQYNSINVSTANSKIVTDLHAKIFEFVSEKLSDIYKCHDCKSRRRLLKSLQKLVLEQFAIDGDSNNKTVLSIFKQVAHEYFRSRLLESQLRIDGRSPTDIRNINIELDFLPKVHGSSIFTRGETQALVTVTLGTVDDEQIVDSLEKEYRERFMLHYNFPSYSVGEVSKMGPPGRREIGHGKLAWRAFNAVIPKQETDFPYTIRVVSDILESNGSSSMATICGTSLALMSTGVNIKEHVAGIAMGLVCDINSDKVVILSDINGDEDHFGDMDFKVAGTKNGITALQMDIKIDQISFAIIKQALAQSVVGYKFILEEMNKAIPVYSEKLKCNVPKFKMLQIAKTKICRVIGAGGKVIRGICDDFNVKVDVSDEGLIRIFSTDQVNIDAACNRIQEITAVPEVGKVYQGIIAKLKSVGAVIQFLGGNEGWLHISEISNKHVTNINNILKEKQKICVKVLGFEESGRINLTIKGVKQNC